MESVQTGRGLREIAEEKAELKTAGLTGSRRTKLPNTLSPQLATLGTAPPEGAQWIHESKYDGYRLLAFCGKKDVILRTRNGHDWSEKFPEIRSALEALGRHECILDGELIALDSNGREDFQRLQNAMKRGRSANPGAEVRLRYMVFDLPHAQGHSLANVPLVERKQLLRFLLQGRDPQLVTYSDHIELSGKRVLKTACDMGLEGIVSKRIDAGYSQKRSRDWIKSKCSNRQEFVIGGYTEPSGSRTGLGALLLGYYKDGKFKYAGKVGTGFDDRMLEEIAKLLGEIEIDATPFDSELSGVQQKGAHWVRPERVVEVKFSGWTDGRHLRHPVFVGLRADKSPETIGIERAETVSAETQKSGSGAAGRRKKTRVTQAVALTHPDRVFYPGIGGTKRDVVDYYEAVAEWMLPYVKNRPLSLLRHPKGWKSKGFFQKHVDESFPEGVHRVDIRKKPDDAAEYYGYVKDFSGLAGLVQMGTLEIHNWGSRVDAVDQPDLIIMDLDPGEGVETPAVLGAAFMLRDVLAEAGLASYLKTTGGKGFHVVIPIRRGPDWNEVKQCAKQIGHCLQARNPDAFTLKASKQLRKGKIYIDYLRNGRGATAIAPFSTRAREGAPVAMPIAWEEADAQLSPNKYTIKNALRRLSQLKTDPWEGFSRRPPGLTKKVRAALGMGSGVVAGRANL